MKRILVFFLILSIGISSAAIGEKLLWITRSLCEGKFVYSLSSYDLEDCSLTACDLEMEQPCIIQGGTEDIAYIADYNEQDKRVDVYVWQNGKVGNCVDSYPVDSIVDRIIAYQHGWLYVTTEESIMRVCQGVEQSIGSIPADLTLNDYAVFKPIINDEGNLAFWDSYKGYDGIRIIYPEDKEKQDDFIGVYLSDGIKESSRESYFIPAPPLAWLDKSHILCFAIRAEFDNEYNKKYYTDAILIDLEQGSWTPYADANGASLSISELQISGYAVSDSDQSHLYLIFGGELGESWTAFEYIPHQNGVGSLSLKSGHMNYLTDFSRIAETMEEYSALAIVNE